MSPINKLKAWLDEEESKSNLSSMYAVLSTVTPENLPLSRVVAIREINDESLLFFTQAGTQKVEDINHNKNVSTTFWLPCTQREVIISGKAEALTDEENRAYWESYPREAQIRFHSYAPTSSQEIESKDVLSEKMRDIEEQYAGQEIPFCPEYCGFRIHFSSLLFYHYRTDELSDVEKYQLVNSDWLHKLLSP